MTDSMLYTLLCVVLPLLVWRLVLSGLALVAMLFTDRNISMKASWRSFEIQASKASERRKPPQA